jgi:hypothetical protein
MRADSADLKAVTNSTLARYAAPTVSVARRLTAAPLVLMLVGCSGAATWTHDPDVEIGPDTTEVIAWVTESACASGQSSADRIIGPDIQVSADAIVVTFRVKALLGVSQTCPSNPPTRVTVRLPEPLGDRVLLDGGREPPEEPPVVAQTEPPICGNPSCD